MVCAVLEPARLPHELLRSVMKMTKLTPMLTVASLEESIRLYRDLLGFECVSHMEAWAALRNGEVEIMIALPNAHLPFERPEFTGCFYFNPDDVDSLWLELKDKTTVV